jgi:hypothetical protein
MPIALSGEYLYFTRRANRISSVILRREGIAEPPQVGYPACAPDIQSRVNPTLVDERPASFEGRANCTTTSG